MGWIPPLSTTSVSRIGRELGGLEECVYCCVQYMVRLQTHWRSGISPTGYGIVGKPREGWVWPVQAQRGNTRAHHDNYGGDARTHQVERFNERVVRWAWLTSLTYCDSASARPILICIATCRDLPLW